MKTAIKAAVIFFVIYFIIRYYSVIRYPLYVVLALLLIAWWIYTYLIPPTFTCPDCKGKFKEPWYRSFISWHFCGARRTTCPHCGRKGYFSNFTRRRTKSNEQSNQKEQE